MGGLLPKSLLTRSTSLHSQCQCCSSGLQHFLSWLCNGLLTGPQTPARSLRATFHMVPHAICTAKLNPLAGPQLLDITQVGTQVLYDLYLYTIIPSLYTMLCQFQVTASYRCLRYSYLWLTGKLLQYSFMENTEVIWIHNLRNKEITWNVTSGLHNSYLSEQTNLYVHGTA